MAALTTISVLRQEEVREGDRMARGVALSPKIFEHQTHCLRVLTVPPQRLSLLSADSEMKNYQLAPFPCLASRTQYTF